MYIMYILNHIFPIKLYVQLYFLVSFRCIQPLYGEHFLRPGGFARLAAVNGPAAGPPQKRQSARQAAVARRRLAGRSAAKNGDRAVAKTATGPLQRRQPARRKNGCCARQAAFARSRPAARTTRRPAGVRMSKTPAKRPFRTSVVRCRAR